MYILIYSYINESRYCVYALLHESKYCVVLLRMLYKNITQMTRNHTGATVP